MGRTMTSRQLYKKANGQARQAIRRHLMNGGHKPRIALISNPNDFPIVIAAWAAAKEHLDPAPVKPRILSVLLAARKILQAPVAPQ